MLVDDEYLILYSLMETLKRVGVEVLAVTSAEDALLALDDKFFDLCFLDVCLPGMEGIEALEHIQLVSPDTGVALMTANCLDQRVA